MIEEILNSIDVIILKLKGSVDIGNKRKISEEQNMIFWRNRKPTVLDILEYVFWKKTRIFSLSLVQQTLQHIRFWKNTLFYKQHIYKQRQTEIGKKSSKS